MAQPTSSQEDYSKDYEADFVMSLTLAAKTVPINYRQVNAEYYELKWYDKVTAWAEKQIRNHLIGARFYQRSDNVIVFTYIFSDEAQRNKFCHSNEYKAVKADLAEEFDILEEVMLNGVDGHSDPGAGP